MVKDEEFKTDCCGSSIVDDGMGSKACANCWREIPATERNA